MARYKNRLQIQKDGEGAPSQEAGVALVEFSIVAFVFVLFITMSVDIGNMLLEYFRLSQVTFEGARAVSMVDGLKEGDSISRPPTKQERDQCFEESSVAPHFYSAPCSLFLAYYRMEELLALSRPQSVLRETQVSVGVTGDGFAQVSTSSHYQAYFYPLRFVTVSASTRLPYFAGRLSSTRGDIGNP